MSKEDFVERDRIHLDLDRSRHENAFPSGESFWTRQIDTLENLLDSHVELLGNQSTQIARREANKARRLQGDMDLDPLVPPLTLGVVGGRGSGKSSLLRTLLGRVENRQEIHVLPKLDPTLFSQADNFLYAFLAALLEELKFLEELNPGGQRGISLASRHAFHDLSEHLWAVDGHESPVGEEEPKLGTILRLDRQRSGPLLRQYVGDFLDRVSEDLGLLANRSVPVVMLLPVDDPDLSFEHLKSLLEHFRRYLWHPYLVPVFCLSGYLTETLLTDHFLRYFPVLSRLGEGKLNATSTSGSTFQGGIDLSDLEDLVDELVDQYLSKLLPVAHRVRLVFPQDELLAASVKRGAPIDSQAGGTDRDAGDSEEGNADDVESYLRELSQNMFGKKDYFEVLIPRSLRNAIRLVDTLNWVRCNQVHQVLERVFPPDLLLTLGEVHSEVLREYRLDIENLYSMDRLSRQHELVSRLILLGSNRITALLEKWASGNTDRVALLLSLFIVEAFKPGQSKRSAALPSRTDSEEAGKEHGSPPLSHWMAWFLRVVNGAYLPLWTQTLSTREGGSYQQNGVDEIRSPKSESAWSPWISSEVGPRYAREATRLGATVLPGHLPLRASAEDKGSVERDMEQFLGSESHKEVWKPFSSWPWISFLDYGEQSDEFRRAEIPRRAKIPRFMGVSDLTNFAGPTLSIWFKCWLVFDSKTNEPAGSVWHGLALLIDILLEEGHTPGQGRGEGDIELNTVHTPEDDKYQARDVQVAQIGEWIKKHLGRERGNANLNEQEELLLEQSSREVAPERSEPNDEGLETEESKFAKLLEELDSWKKTYSAKPIEPISAISSLHATEFFREFWRRIESVHQKPMREWGSGTMLQQWLKGVISYWKEQKAEEIAEAFERCPLIAPLLSQYQEVDLFVFRKASTRHKVGAKDSSFDLNLSWRTGREEGSQNPFYSGLTLVQLLDAVVPADVEQYLSQAAEQAPLVDPPTSEMI